MTIEIPTPSSDLLAQIETATIELTESNEAAVRALREKFSRYAKHNGYVKTGSYERVDAGKRISVEREAYARGANRRKLRALLVVDDFRSAQDEEFRGRYAGTRLYLTESGAWLELKRVGHWSRWEGSPDFWYADAESFDALNMGDEPQDRKGFALERTDAQVLEHGYALEDMLAGLAASMKTMCEKLPQRHAKIRASAELAAGVISALR